MPVAEAAFPGRNGRIAIAILQPPFSSLPTATVLPVVADRDLFTVTGRGGALRQITGGTEYSDVAPSWSPDGKRIAFARMSVVRGVLGSDIYVIEASGTGARNLTNTPTVFEWAPSWSPDGTRIVFASDRAQPDLLWRLAAFAEAEQDLYIMDADGGNLVRLTSDAGAEGDPAWSPDGHWIAFRDLVSISLIRPDGRDRRVLTTEVQGLAPRWSPDGSRIVFAGESESEIWVINPDGSRLRNLTARHPGRNTRPAWSPDGKWIAFVSDRDGSWKLYRMRPDGSDVRKLIDLDLQSPLSTPDWGPRP